MATLIKEKIIRLLENYWGNYLIDLHPKDRRMKILAKRGVNGMSSENIRFLVNELVRTFATGGVYLEVGSFQGCSLLSAAIGNSSTKCIGIDDFSQFNKEKRNEQCLIKNLEKFKELQNIKWYKGDYCEIIPRLFTRDQIPNVNVYFYDGEHSYNNQLRGLEIIVPYLSNNAILIIDDFNWKQVEEATNFFVNKNKDFNYAFKIKTKGNCSGDWWNGLAIVYRKN